MKELTGDTIKSYYLNKATEKARIKNITINGQRATAVFLEYEAPAELIPEFEKQDGSDGHFFYIVFYMWAGVKSYYTGKDIATAHNYITDKTEGNAIYKQIKATKQFDINAE